MTISRHTIRADVAAVGAVGVKSADVALDESWAPYGRATLVCAPMDSAVFDALDPRTAPPPRVTLTLTQSYGNPVTAAELSAAWAGLTLADLSTLYAGMLLSAITAEFTVPFNLSGYRPPVTRTFNLGVRSRRREPVSGEVVLELATDEALLQDYGLFSSSAVSPSALTVRDAVELALVYAIGATTMPGTAGAEVITAESAAWTPGTSAWDYVRPLVDSAGLRLWCDETRVWHLEAPLSGANGTLALSGDGTIVQADDTVTRDGTTSEWADAVVVIYEWTDGSNVRHTTYDVAADPGASRTRTVTYQRPDPGAGAAAALLKRVKARGREVGVQAVNDYAATPGQVLQVNLPDLETQTGMVSSVSWSLPADEMQVRSRELVDTIPTAWLLLPAGVAWEDSPVGVSWEDPDPDPAEGV